MNQILDRVWTILTLEKGKRICGRRLQRKRQNQHQKRRQAEWHNPAWPLPGGLKMTNYLTMRFSFLVPSHVCNINISKSGTMPAHYISPFYLSLCSERRSFGFQLKCKWHRPYFFFFLIFFIFIFYILFLIGLSWSFTMTKLKTSISRPFTTNGALRPLPIHFVLFH